MTAPDSLDGTDPLLRGVGLDAQTRCAHYATARDVVALRFACCPAYWSCHRCHAELADHPAVPVPAGDFVPFIIDGPPVEDWGPNKGQNWNVTIHRQRLVALPADHMLTVDVWDQT